MPGLIRNIQASARSLADNDIFFFAMSGVPVSGASGTGVGVTGPGSSITNVLNGDTYYNNGTKTVPQWVLVEGVRVVTLTSAQVKVVRATPITIIAAQGAGLVIEFIAGMVFVKYGGTNVWTNPQNLALRYKDSAGVIVSGAITAAGLVDQAGSIAETIPNVAGAIVAKANCDNQPVLLHNTGASEIAGNAANDNTLTIQASFRVWVPGW